MQPRLQIPILYFIVCSSVYRSIILPLASCLFARSRSLTAVEHRRGSHGHRRGSFPGSGPVRGGSAAGRRPPGRLPGQGEQGEPLHAARRAPSPEQRLPRVCRRWWTSSSRTSCALSWTSPSERTGPVRRQCWSCARRPCSIQCTQVGGAARGGGGGER